MSETRLSNEEAQTLLTALNDFSVKDLRYAPALAKVVGKLIAFVNAPDKPKKQPSNPEELVHIAFDVGTQDKIAAIRILRNLTNFGLKEAKEHVENSWRDGSQINAGVMAVRYFEQAKQLLATSSPVLMPLIKWIVTGVPK